MPPPGKAAIVFEVLCGRTLVQAWCHGGRHFATCGKRRLPPTESDVLFFEGKNCVAR